MMSRTHHTETHTVFQHEVVTRPGARIALAVGRIVIGWTFLWAFLDKTCGLGFTTPADEAWIRGGIGVAMVLGAGLKIAAVTGTLLMLFMYLTGLPFLGEAPGTNPITDSHWIEALLLIIWSATLAGDTRGIGKWWAGKVGNSWLR